MASAVLGLASAGSISCLGLIECDNRGVFAFRELANFQTDDLSGKVSMLVALVKLLRFAVAVPGPNSKFHLIPGIRRRTPNGHHVTWLRDGLLKELRAPLSSQRMVWLQTIYAAKCLHVEHGIVRNSGDVMITRIGPKLQDCIEGRVVSKETAIHHIRAGIHELHQLGFAHCDISVHNCFVDTCGPSPVVFLDDLEYVRPLQDAPPPVETHNSRLPRGVAYPSTAQQLDLLQFESLQAEIERM